jgi:beta-lactamase class A
MTDMRKLATLCAILLASASAAAAQGGPGAGRPIDRLQRNVERIADGLSAHWGIFAESLDTGEQIAIHADRPMETMSDIKVALLVTAFRQIDAGKLHLDQPVTLTAADKRFGTGVLRTLHDGLQLTLRDVLTLMVIQSDNSATDLAYRLVGGPGVVTQTMRKMGFQHITSERTTFSWFRALAAAGDPAYETLSPAELFARGFPRTPSFGKAVERFDAEGQAPFGLANARDMGHLLAEIARGRAASPESCRQMLRILRMQQMNTRIPKYITGASIGHKTGDFPPYIANDVAIVESPEAKFVLVIFDDHYHGIYANLEDGVARIAQQVWLYFSYRAPARAASERSR